MTKKPELVFPEMCVINPTRKRNTKKLYKYLEKSERKISADQIIQSLRGGIYTGLRDTHQRTLLHHAAECGNIKIVRYLLDMGEDIDALDSRHETPLWIAAGTPEWRAPKNYKTSEVAMELLNRGAQVDISDWRGSYLIFRVKDPQILNALIKCGASIERRNWENETPLHARSDDSLTSTFLEYGANVHTENNKGKTIFEKKHSDHIHYTIKRADQYYASFAQQGTPPTEISQLYDLLMVWPLSNPKMEVDRIGHMRQIFGHAKWPSTAAAEQIAQGLLEDKQISIFQHQFLMETAFPAPDKKAIFTPKRRCAL